MNIRSKNENYQLWEMTPSGWSPEDPQPSDSKTYACWLVFESPDLEAVKRAKRAMPEGWEFAFTEIRFPKSWEPPVYAGQHEDEAPF